MHLVFNYNLEFSLTIILSRKEQTPKSDKPKGKDKIGKKSNRCKSVNPQKILYVTALSSPAVTGQGRSNTKKYFVWCQMVSAF